MYKILSLFAFIILPILEVYATTSIYFHLPFTDTNLCAGNPLTIHDSLTYTYNSGNTFTVQLSDASGNFTSPTTIGSVSATTTSSISCTISSATPTGSGYRIRIIASSPADTSANNGINIVINNLPASSISTNSPVCFGDSLYINASNSNTNATYSWTGPNNFSSSVQNLSTNHATFADSGMFHLVTSAGACSKTDSVHIIIKPVPAFPTIGSNSPLCAHDSLHLYASNTSAGVSFSWSGPNSFSSSLQNPSKGNVALSDSGLYHLSLTLNGCHTYDSVGIMIKPLPGLPLASSNAPVCVGDSLHLSATDTSAGVSYFWYGPNSFSASIQYPSISNVAMADTGYYFVSAVLNNCYRTGSIYISLHPKPSLPQINSNSPICASNSLYMVANDSTAGVSYQWIGPNSFNSSSQSPIINNAVPADSGLYKLVAISGTCVSDTATANVVVNPHVIPSVFINTNPYPVIAGLPTQFSAIIANGGINPIVQWRRNGVDMPGYVVNPTIITIAAGDIITVFIQSNAACASPDTAVSAGVTTGISNVNSSANIKIYPNPASKALYIDAPVKTKCSISGMDGKTLIKDHSLSAHEAIPIDLSMLASGLYIVELYDENGLLIKVDKFVKQ